MMAVHLLIVLLKYFQIVLELLFLIVEVIEVLFVDHSALHEVLLQLLNLLLNSILLLLL